MGTLKVFAIVVLILCAIFSIRATLVVKYSDELSLVLKVLFLKIKILPKKKKKPKISDGKPKKVQKRLAKLEKKKEKKPIVLRFYVVYIFIACLFGAIIYKIADIQYVKGDELRKLAEQRITAPNTITPVRGNILSHDGRLLSSALPYYKVYIDLKVPALSVKNKTTKKTYFEEHVRELAEALAKKFPNKNANQYEKDLRQKYREAQKSEKKSFTYALHNGWISHIDYLEVKTFPILKRGAIQGGLTTRKKTTRVRP